MQAARSFQHSRSAEPVKANPFGVLRSLDGTCLTPPGVSTWPLASSKVHMRYTSCPQSACSDFDISEAHQLPVCLIRLRVCRRLIQRANDDDPGTLPTARTDQLGLFLVWRLLAVPAPPGLDQSLTLEDGVVFLSAFFDRGRLEQILEDIPQGPFWMRTGPQIDNIRVASQRPANPVRVAAGPHTTPPPAHADGHASPALY